MADEEITTPEPKRKHISSSNGSCDGGASMADKETITPELKQKHSRRSSDSYDDGTSSEGKPCLSTKADSSQKRIVLFLFRSTKPYSALLLRCAAVGGAVSFWHLTFTFSAYAIYSHCAISSNSLQTQWK